ncbi:uncharacterized protein LOC106670992 isoform X3 [Cimex lectularius]|uniref:Inorganic phosphate cotransporter n=1 Tax=Cimex lectularius TaxID=79782 RepID=A0A8I6SQ38_CIMLE|nr:uncharacterized protein LOC106670992 isoform X3 [Cimex lectularius]
MVFHNCGDGICIPFGFLSIRKFQAVLMSFSLMCYVSTTNLLGIMDFINEEHLREGGSDWNILGSSGFQLVITSFFIGYLMSSILSGIMVTRLNSVIMISRCMLANAVITVFTPYLVRSSSWSGFCLTRFSLGISSGFINSSILDILANWCPKIELIVTGNIVFSGHYLGNIVSAVLSSTIGQNENWPNVFYVSSILSFTSAALWHLYGCETPYKCSYITLEELLYLQANLKDLSLSTEKVIPWKGIFQNNYFIVTMISHSANNWCFWFLVFEIPIYLKDVLRIEPHEVKTLIILPYAMTYATSFITAYTLQMFIWGNVTSIENSRKLCNTIALWGLVFCFAVIWLTVTSFSSVSMYALAVVLNYYSFFGHVINYIDLSPNFCGLLIGIANCLGNIPTALGYLFVSKLVSDTSISEEWNPAFIMSAGAAFLGGLFFLGGGSVEVQQFNYINTQKMYRSTRTSRSMFSLRESVNSQPQSVAESIDSMNVQEASSASIMKEKVSPFRKMGSAIGKVIPYTMLNHLKTRGYSPTFINLESELSKGPITQSTAVVTPIIHDMITNASMKQLQMEINTLRKKSLYSKLMRSKLAVASDEMVGTTSDSPKELDDVAPGLNEKLTNRKASTSKQISRESLVKRDLSLFKPESREASTSKQISHESLVKQGLSLFKPESREASTSKQISRESLLKRGLSLFKPESREASTSKQLSRESLLKRDRFKPKLKVRSISKEPLEQLQKKDQSKIKFDLPSTSEQLSPEKLLKEDQSKRKSEIPSTYEQLSPEKLLKEDQSKKKSEVPSTSKQLSPEKLSKEDQSKIKGEVPSTSKQESPEKLLKDGPSKQQRQEKLLKKDQSKTKLEVLPDIYGPSTSKKESQEKLPRKDLSKTSLGAVPIHEGPSTSNQESHEKVPQQDQSKPRLEVLPKHDGPSTSKEEPQEKLPKGGKGSRRRLDEAGPSRPKESQEISKQKEDSQKDPTQPESEKDDKEKKDDEHKDDKSK